MSTCRRQRTRNSMTRVIRVPDVNNIVIVKHAPALDKAAATASITECTWTHATESRAAAQIERRDCGTTARNREWRTPPRKIIIMRTYIYACIIYNCTSRRDRAKTVNTEKKKQRK